MPLIRQQYYARVVVILFQCSIDLKRNMLVIGTTGTETRFLAEGDLPEHARLNKSPSSPEEAMDEDRQLAEALAKSQEEGAGNHDNQMLFFLLF